MFENLVESGWDMKLLKDNIQYISSAVSVMESGKNSCESLKSKEIKCLGPLHCEHPFAWDLWIQKLKRGWC